MHIHKALHYIPYELSETQVEGQSYVSWQND